MDWEIELAVIIGQEVKRGTAIDKTTFMDHIFGFTVGLDISARDWQSKNKNGGQVLIAKSMDSFCPLGKRINGFGCNVCSFPIFKYSIINYLKEQHIHIKSS